MRRQGSGLGRDPDLRLLTRFENSKFGYSNLFRLPSLPRETAKRYLSGVFFPFAFSLLPSKCLASPCMLWAGTQKNTT